MTSQPQNMHDHGPLILGASGQVGQALRTLWSSGHWPSGAEPLWHSRAAGGQDYQWDMLTQEAPSDNRLANTYGVIVLTGGSQGQVDPDENTNLAKAAIDLADRENLGPVLLCSSQAVYGPASGPQTENADPKPANAYGAAKLAMEQAVATTSRVCCLRIGNVAGCDMLLRNASKGPVALDQFADGSAPHRCYIGPKSLASTMLALIACPDLPPRVNVAAPGEIGMDQLLDEAGAEWSWHPAPPTALARLNLDLSLLQAIAPLPQASGTAEALIAEARQSGWSIHA